MRDYTSVGHDCKLSGRVGTGVLSSVAICMMVSIREGESRPASGQSYGSSVGQVGVRCDEERARGGGLLGIPETALLKARPHTPLNLCMPRSLW